MNYLYPRTCKTCSKPFYRMKGEKHQSFTARNHCEKCKQNSEEQS